MLHLEIVVQDKVCRKEYSITSAAWTGAVARKKTRSLARRSYEDSIGMVENG